MSRTESKVAGGNFWDNLTCKGFNVLVQPIEANNIPSNYFNFNVTNKNSKEDPSNRQRKNHHGEDVICPCCGHNLGSKLTLLNRNSSGGQESGRSSRHVDTKREKGIPPKSGEVQRKNHSSISKGLKNEDQDKPLEPRTSEQRAVTVCDSNYRTNLKRGGHRTLSELLRLDEIEPPSDRPPQEFSNDWTRVKPKDSPNGKGNEQSYKELYKSTSSPKSVRKIWMSDENDRQVENDDQTKARDGQQSGSKKQEEDPKRNGKRVVAEQINSRTYLRDQRIVQNMRNCWEHYLQLQLNMYSRDRNWEQYDLIKEQIKISRSFNDFPQKGQVIDKDNNNSSNKLKSNLSNEEISRGRIKEIVKQVQSDRVERKKTASLDLENCNNNNQGGGSSGRKSRRSLQHEEDEKRTFEEIRHEFEVCALEYLKRVQMANEEDKLAKGKTSQSQNPKNVSSEDKVISWMEQNEQLCKNPGLVNEQRNEGPSQSKHYSLDKKDHLRNENPKQSSKEKLGNEQKDKRKDFNFIQLATMSNSRKHHHEERQKVGQSQNKVKGDQDSRRFLNDIASQAEKMNRRISEKNSQCPPVPFLRLDEDGQ